MVGALNREGVIAAGEEALAAQTHAALLAACAQAFAYPKAGIASTLGALRGLRMDGDDGGSQRVRAGVTDVLDASGCFEDETAEKLAYTRLFIGSLQMEAPPYASYYAGNERLLNGKPAAEVAAVYAQFGLQLQDEENAPADHLRYMLHFLALLMARYGETGEDAFLEAYCDFRDDYITPWYAEFARLVERCADAPYYPVLVSLIATALSL